MTVKETFVACNALLFATIFFAATCHTQRLLGWQTTSHEWFDTFVPIDLPTTTS
jgi:hypothetical protein